MNANGKVQYLNERAWNGKTLYSLRLAGDEALYLCGETRPEGINRGDFVTFDYRENKNGKYEVDVRSIRVKKEEVLKPGGSRSWTGPSGGYDKRQETIEYQAARNSAIAAAGVLLQAGAVKLPAKDADKYGVVVGLITDLTNRFFEETKTLGKPPKEEAAEENKEPEGDKTDADEDWE